MGFEEGGGGPATEIARDLACLRIVIVNVFLYGAPGAGDRGWVLIDAGLRGSAGRIRAAAADRFGDGARPAAIVLTHAHFDHVGALEELAREWDVPVYAHPLEHPYLDGRSSYPPPDPTVGGGAMARLSPLYPRGPWQVSERLHDLPVSGAVPAMPGWTWHPTPGHSPGHVSLFRDSDRVLVAGDAVVTTKQESMLSALWQRPELHGPPMYFTHDWRRARESVELIAELQPDVLATGHGRPLQGPSVAEGLRVLAREFEMLAVPLSGRYVAEPATFDTSGPVFTPPPIPDRFPHLAALLGIGLLAGIAGAALLRRRTHDGVPGELHGDYGPVGSAFEDQQHVPVADDRGAPYGAVDERMLPRMETTTGRPFDWGMDPSAPGDVPGGP